MSHVMVCRFRLMLFMASRYIFLFPIEIDDHTLRPLPCTHHQYAPLHIRSSFIGIKATLDAGPHFQAAPDN